MVNVDNTQLLKRVNEFLGKDVTSWTLFKTIEELLKVGEWQQKSIGEADVMIAELQEEVKRYKLKENLLLEINKTCRHRIFELKRKTGYQVYEENISLIQEVEELKKKLQKAEFWRDHYQKLAERLVKS